MWTGFVLASYSVVGNDAIQTLGTFLSSNEKTPWYILWFFAAGILFTSLLYGYSVNDVDFGRLDKFSAPESYKWYFLLPPLVLLTITNVGIPVSTTFMILTLFSISNIDGSPVEIFLSTFDSSTKLGGMVNKSVMGYLIAFILSLVLYLIISKSTENIFKKNPIPSQKKRMWIAFQWITTGFLWFQWLSQDLANIYIYLGPNRDLSILEFLASALVLVGLLGLIFKLKGGAIQKLVLTKTNTTDIRSATIIDLLFSIILVIFKNNGLGLFDAKLPMSTTWVFIGLLAGRELAIKFSLKEKISKSDIRLLANDLFKVFTGLFVSVFLVIVIKVLA